MEEHLHGLGFRSGPSRKTPKFENLDSGLSFRIQD
jgi:hypothetical protein